MISIQFITLIVLLSVWRCDSLLKTRHGMPLNRNFSLRRLINANFVKPLRHKSATKLQLDLFGLGPAEVIVIAGAVVLLFGPDRIKSQLRDSGVKNTITSEGWKAEQEEKVQLMRNNADEKRKQRSWSRINNAIDREDPEIMQRLEDYENFP